MSSIMRDDDCYCGLLADDTHKIIGAAMEVYNILGSGFLENVYRDALGVEFAARDFSYEQEKLVNIFYKEVKLPSYYKADLMCFGNIILELKAKKELTKEDEAQLVNYLKATGIPVGLLFNFGNPRRLEWRRLIYTDKRYSGMC
ncbi:GxxExxY protein [Methanorbis furvi]|uniref:GxxExxY protein n=1 Tax=Methanorbis furvi TaxID=3028299 RepID=A0AAE4MAB2_9EURY|nr:hypothetical protein [Methanocorpusculaceae archaeon Ag1]